MNKKFLTVLVASAAALVVACTPTRTQKTAGEQVDDSSITAKVKSELLRDSKTNGMAIDVETRRGTVQLNGFVPSAEMKSEAGRVARRVDGVRTVDNNLQVSTEKRTAGEYVDDTVITAKVKAALIGNDETKARDINVQTREGVVQLSGFVDSSAQKSEATRVAQDVGGVKRVVNDLTVKRM